MVTTGPHYNIYKSLLNPSRLMTDAQHDLVMTQRQITDHSILNRQRRQQIINKKRRFVERSVLLQTADDATISSHNNNVHDIDTSQTSIHSIQQMDSASSYNLTNQVDPTRAVQNYIHRDSTYDNNTLTNPNQSSSHIREISDGRDNRSRRDTTSHERPQSGDRQETSYNRGIDMPNTGADNRFHNNTSEQLTYNTDNRSTNTHHTATRIRLQQPETHGDNTGYKQQDNWRPVAASIIDGISIHDDVISTITKQSNATYLDLGPSSTEQLGSEEHPLSITHGDLNKTKDDLRNRWDHGSEQQTQFTTRNMDDEISERNQLYHEDLKDRLRGMGIPVQSPNTQQSPPPPPTHPETVNQSKYTSNSHIPSPPPPPPSPPPHTDDETRRTELAYWRRKVTLEEESAVKQAGMLLSMLSGIVETISGLFPNNFIKTKGLSEQVEKALEGGEFDLCIKDYCVSPGAIKMLRNPIMSFITSFLYIVLKTHVQHIRQTRTHSHSSKDDHKKQSNDHKKQSKKHKHRRHVSQTSSDSSSSTAQSSDDGTARSDRRRSTLPVSRTAFKANRDKSMEFGTVFVQQLSSLAPIMGTLHRVMER